MQQDTSYVVIHWQMLLSPSWKINDYYMVQIIAVVHDIVCSMIRYFSARALLYVNYASQAPVA